MIRSLILAFLLLAMAPLAAAQIYRCETGDGVVFSDRECGPAAEIVEIEDATSGVSIGPPQEVRDRLAQQREAWAEEAQARREALAREPPPPSQPVVIERRVGVPYWGWPGAGYPRPPGNRPRPPIEPPVEPPVTPPGRPGGGNVMRPPR
jgi:hypothetical protein